MSRKIKIRGVEVITEKSTDKVPFIERVEQSMYFPGMELQHSLLLVEGSGSLPPSGDLVVPLSCDIFSGNLMIRQSGYIRMQDDVEINYDFLKSLIPDDLRAVCVSVSFRGQDDNQTKENLIYHSLISMYYNFSCDAHNIRTVTSIDGQPTGIIGGSTTPITFDDHNSFMIEHIDNNPADMGITSSDIVDGNYELVYNIVYVKESDIIFKHTLNATAKEDSYEIKTGYMKTYSHTSGIDTDEMLVNPIVQVTAETPKIYSMLNIKMSYGSPYWEELNMCEFNSDQEWVPCRQVKFDNDVLFAALFAITPQMFEMQKGAHNPPVPETTDIVLNTANLVILPINTPVLKEGLMSANFNISYEKYDWTTTIAELKFKAKFQTSFDEGTISIKHPSSAYYWGGQESVYYQYFMGVMPNMELNTDDTLFINGWLPQIMDFERDSRPEEEKDSIYDRLLNLSTDFCSYKIWDYILSFEEVQ